MIKKNEVSWHTHHTIKYKPFVLPLAYTHTIFSTSVVYAKYVALSLHTHIFTRQLMDSFFSYNMLYAPAARHSIEVSCSFSKRILFLFIAHLETRCGQAPLMRLLPSVFFHSIQQNINREKRSLADIHALLAFIPYKYWQSTNAPLFSFSRERAFISNELFIIWTDILFHSCAMLPHSPPEPIGSMPARGTSGRSYPRLSQQMLICEELKSS